MLSCTNTAQFTPEFLNLLLRKPAQDVIVWENILESNLRPDILSYDDRNRVLHLCWRALATATKEDVDTSSSNGYHANFTTSIVEYILQAERSLFQCDVPATRGHLPRVEHTTSRNLLLDIIVKSVDRKSFGECKYFASKIFHVLCVVVGVAWMLECFTPLFYVPNSPVVEVWDASYTLNNN